MKKFIALSPEDIEFAVAFFAASELDPDSVDDGLIDRLQVTFHTQKCDCCENAVVSALVEEVDE